MTPISAWSPARVARILFAIALLVRLLHLAFLQAAHPEILAHPVVDAAYYHRWAQDILAGGAMTRQAVFHAPGLSASDGRRLRRLRARARGRRDPAGVPGRRRGGAVFPPLPPLVRPHRRRPVRAGARPLPPPHHQRFPAGDRRAGPLFSSSCRSFSPPSPIRAGPPCDGPLPASPSPGRPQPRQPDDPCARPSARAHPPDTRPRCCRDCAPPRPWPPACWRSCWPWASATACRRASG